jgi:hypothetical protein
MNGIPGQSGYPQDDLSSRVVESESRVCRVWAAQPGDH